MKHVVNLTTGASRAVATTAAEDAARAVEEAAWTAGAAARIASAELVNAKAKAVEAIFESEVDDPRNDSLPEVVAYRGNPGRP